jgi:hypothetical protein
MNREINSLDQAVVLLDEWIAAYEQLRLQHVRLLHEHTTTKEQLSHALFAIECDLAIDEFETMQPEPELDPFAL